MGTFPYMRCVPIAFPGQAWQLYGADEFLLPAVNEVFGHLVGLVVRVLPGRVLGKIG